MVTGVVFAVLVEQVAGGADLKRRPQLKRSSTRLLLHVALEQTPSSGNPLGGTKHRGRSQCVGLDDPRCLSLGVDEDRERKVLVLDECCGVSR